MAEYAYNGWLASPNPADFGGLQPLVVAGESFSPGVRAGDVHEVLSYVAEQVNARVEPVYKPGWHEADDWGYNYRQNRNANNLSCHAAGCAIDYNATLHPNGRRGTFTPGQVATIRAILREVDSVVEWGGNFSGTADEMHFEIAGSQVEVGVVADRLRAKKAAPVPAPAPAPRPAPAPAPASKFHDIPMGGVTGLGAHGAQVAADQRDLIDSGFSVGDSGADGYAGAATVEAIKAAQRGGGLLIDGEMGEKTRAMLHRVPAWSKHTTSAVQARLGHFGYRLTLDGKLGPKTEGAIRAFQTRMRLTVDGTVGPITWTALYTR